MPIIDATCKVDGVIDSENYPYDLSEIEEVERIYYIGIYNKYKGNWNNVENIKISKFEAMDDFNLTKNIFSINFI